MERTGHAFVLGHKESSVHPLQIALDELPSHMLASFQLMATSTVPAWAPVRHDEPVPGEDHRHPKIPNLKQLIKYTLSQKPLRVQAVLVNPCRAMTDSQYLADPAHIF